ncbi:hypothetical protein JOB18_036685 [Solea senegalensis]|uniref:Uncharacterized protein n=1 Tax=Solea senegalensis TaxID=28829 RepID=A0AAV6QX25_SOLSE|nr:hypothetical protein JOB18_036685 [Solea senegalensis]
MVTGGCAGTSRGILYVCEHMSFGLAGDTRQPGLSSRAYDKDAASFWISSLPQMSTPTFTPPHPTSFTSATDDRVTFTEYVGSPMGWVSSAQTPRCFVTTRHTVYSGNSWKINATLMNFRVQVLHINNHNKFLPRQQLCADEREVVLGVVGKRVADKS